MNGEPGVFARWSSAHTFSGAQPSRNAGGTFQTDLAVPAVLTTGGRHAAAEAAERRAAAITICARARNRADAELLLDVVLGGAL